MEWEYGKLKLLKLKLKLWLVIGVAAVFILWQTGGGPLKIATSTAANSWSDFKAFSECKQLCFRKLGANSNKPNDLIKKLGIGRFVIIARQELVQTFMSQALKEPLDVRTCTPQKKKSFHKSTAWIWSSKVHRIKMHKANTPLRL